MTSDKRRPLLVGRDPAKEPKTGELARPFVGSRSGKRLADLCGLQSDEDLPKRFELRNLYAHTVPGLIEDWDDARRRAGRIMELLTNDRYVVLFGGDVARAFGVGNQSWFEFRWHPRGFHVATSPHPSGRSRFWNDPENVAHAEEFFGNLTETFS